MLPKAGHKTSLAVPFQKHRPLTTVDYEQQIDYLTEWINKWDNAERFIFIERLLSKCDKEQIQFLWTVLQPTLHRDFIFNSLSAEPNSKFNPISTPVTREIHKRAHSLRSKGKKVPFLKSAILRNKEDVQKWTSCSVLPIMKSPSPTSTTRFSFRGSPVASEVISGTWKSHQSYFGVKFPGIKKPHARSVQSVKSAPPKLGYSPLKHQTFRRHMQEKEDYKIKKGITKSHELCPKHVNWNQVANEETQTILNWFENGWNDWMKNEFLKIFLKILEPSELFYISGLIVVRQYRDFIALLPRRLSRSVFLFLNVEELALVSQVSRAWSSVANDEHLWKDKCNGIYIGIPLSRANHWKTVYKESVELRKNWFIGHCTLTEISGHTSRVLSVRGFENLIASGSFDKTIKVWDANLGTLLHTLEGHSKGVWCLCFLSKTVLISGSHDSTIRVWNLRTGNCAKILMSHTGPVWAMERKGDILLTGSGDKTAKVWNIRQCRLTHTLIAHNASVFCVDLDEQNNRAFTGSADHTVRIWNLVNGKCLKCIFTGVKGLASAVTSLSYGQGFLAVASGNCVSLWNVENKECTKEFLGHNDRVESVKLKLRLVQGEIQTGFIYSAGKDGVVKYWDFHEGTCIKSLRGHKTSVNSLFVDDTTIISASEDNKIRVWNFMPSTTRQRNKVKELKKYMSK